jgi:hypothetical protein
VENLDMGRFKEQEIFAYDDKVQEDRMGKAYNMCGREVKLLHNFVEKLQERCNWEEQTVDGGSILIRISCNLKF